MKLERCFLPLLSLTMAGCFAEEPIGLLASRPALTTVRVDLLHRPLPELPLPNDLATRHDSFSATGRRLNVPVLAATRFESRLREKLNELDGWGVFQYITIPFTGALDVSSILAAHRDRGYDLADDVVYLIDVDPRSPELGRVFHLDLGNGNYPFVLERRGDYWHNDPRGDTMTLLYEETEEDLNGNGHLDPGEDTDADGVLDHPNYLPGRSPAPDDLAGRADALMTFYERETHTLIFRPLVPLRERTTYAVVVTRRLRDAAGEPVGSPYPYVHHLAQTEALKPLLQVLPEGLAASEVAFAFSFTTQSVASHLRAVREGLAGHGVQGHLGREFPAEVIGLERLRDPRVLAYVKNPYLLHPEEVVARLKPIITAVLGVDDGSAAMAAFVNSQRYVDYHVIGSFRSPQLFPRTHTDLTRPAAEFSPGEEGGVCTASGTCTGALRCYFGRCVALLPYNEQAWPADLDRVPAPARAEEVPFLLSIPRREVSVRGEGRPAPVVLHSHGTGNSKVENVMFSGFFAKHGFATLAIDNPSQGLGLGHLEATLAKALLAGSGLEPFVDAMLKGRAFDQNNDGLVDSAADLWTVYVFHTRDMVRQAVLDGMQAIRVLRGFDGERRWKVDVNGDGTPELAGDFDGDGQVDAGGDVALYLTGISQGGIVTLLEGAMEPELTAIAPISGGAGLADVAIRTTQFGVPEAFALRLMGPLYLGTLDPSSGEMTLEILVPDINRRITRKNPSPGTFATVRGVAPGDTVVVVNLANGERGCAIVSAEGLFRAGVASDVGDPARIEFYEGEVLEGPDCQVRSGAQPRLLVDTFGQDVVFQGQIHTAGSPLMALAEGLGLRRASPAFRRFFTLGQVASDPGDPVAYLRHLQREPLDYPALSQQTGAHALIIPTIGDTAVPISTGIAAGRAAGLVDFLGDDPRYGKPVNQVLIDTHTCEGVHNLGRYHSTADPSGSGVHLDVDNYSQGTDFWGGAISRLDPPLRIGWGRADPLGGASAMVFPLSYIQGSHYFDLPGMMIDRARDFCLARCSATDGPDPCGCLAQSTFDLGTFFYNLIGRYFASGGTILDDDLCNARDDCPDLRPAPEFRDPRDCP